MLICLVIIKTRGIYTYTLSQSFPQIICHHPSAIHLGTHGLRELRFFCDHEELATRRTNTTETGLRPMDRPISGHLLELHFANLSCVFIYNVFAPFFCMSKVYMYSTLVCHSFPRTITPLSIDLINRLA